MEMCHYGCGQEAKFKNKSGNWMCSKSSNSCPENRRKNKEKTKEAYTTGVRQPASLQYSSLPQETRDRMNHRIGKRLAEFGYPGKGQFKNALLSERGHKCECCGNTEWMGKMITIELEHSDGDRKNNTRENLKLLCPNCHAQTPTWRRSSNQVGFKKQRYTDEVMIEAIKTSFNLNQVLTKLDLRYGSVSTIVRIMTDYKVNFIGG